MIRLAGCVLLDEQKKIGLLHRNKNGVIQWELPGGKVEPGESPEAAAVRELYEELGVIVAVERELGSMGFMSDDKAFHYVWFLARITRHSPLIKEPEAFDDFRHFSIKEMETLELSANMANLHRNVRDGTIRL